MSLKNEQLLEQMRHSAAHLLAHAVLELFPDTLLTIGPATKEGFFFDFVPGARNFKQEDLASIESRMHDIVKRNLIITHEQVEKDVAYQLYHNNPFKRELIEAIPGTTVGIARQGEFFDLCRGGHVACTGDIKHFKLLAISGSYWRADRDNQPLQRISGTAFLTAQDLADFEQRIIDAQLYDHRALGKELDLFSFSDDAPGFPFYHPNGKIVMNVLTNYLRNTLSTHGYVEVSTPQMLNADLWKRSGHYDHYKQNMYFCTIEDQLFALKPMNCPGSIIIYKHRPRSYRELPLRLAEFGLVHRYELSGVLHGLFRVRAFTIDDGHIYCTPAQLESEVCLAIQLTYEVLRRFKFTDILVYLSTRPANSMGSDELWEKATNALAQGLNKSSIPFTICEGEGAFYGPKIEFHILDSMGRTWQCSTVQIDFFQPQNFDLSYVSSEGTKEHPVIVHRAIYGSFERFFGILLEHYKGKLPFWLSPVQVAILPVTEAQSEYAQKTQALLQQQNIRTRIDTTGDQLSSQIKRAQLQKIPWMIIVGAKEVANETYTIRYLDGKQEQIGSKEALIQKVSAALSE